MHGEPSEGKGQSQLNANCSWAQGAQQGCTVVTLCTVEETTCTDEILDLQGIQGTSICNGTSSSDWSNSRVLVLPSVVRKRHIAA